MKNRFIVIAGVVVIILVVGFLYNKFLVAPKIKFEALELTDLNGKEVLIDSFKDKKLFINFFATWCAPCVKELPSILAAQQKLTKEGFQFILISDEPVEKLINFSRKNQNQFKIYHSLKEIQSYKIYSIPASYILNSYHEIVFKQTGEKDWASEEIIKKFLEVK